MTATRRSLGFSFLEKVFVLVSGLAVTSIVARILSPAEIGLFFVASAVVIMVEALRDFGISNCLIQEPQLRPELVRTTFTVMLVLSLVLALLLYLGADAVAAFYGEPRLAGLIHIATLGFLFGPISNPLFGLLRREMAFDVIARINVTAALLNGGTSMVLALAGFGASSFIWASVVAAASNAVLTSIACGRLWMFRPSLKSLGRVMSFGAYSSVIMILSLIYDFAPRLILGRVLDFGAVGLFGRAMSICQLPDKTFLGALQPVLLPALSTHARQGGDLKASYLNAISYLSAVHWPCLVVLALLAEPIVRVLLGAQWASAVPLVRIMTLASLAMLPALIAAPLLISIGRVQDAAKLSLIWTPLGILAYLVTAHLGLEIVAASLFFTIPVQAVVGLWLIRPIIHLTLADMARSTWRGGVITLCTALPPGAAYVYAEMNGGMSVLLGAMAGVAAGAAWLVGTQVSAHPLRSELDWLGGVARRRLQRLRPWPA